MKKKLISLLVTTAMAVTLFAGCGAKEETPAQDPAPAEEEAPAQEEAPAEAETPAEEETPAEDTAAADEGAANYDGVTLTMWSMWANTEPQGKVLQEAADAFSAQTGATINIEWKGRDVKTIIATALEANEDRKSVV